MPNALLDNHFVLHSDSCAEIFLEKKTFWKNSAEFYLAAKDEKWPSMQRVVWTPLTLLLGKINPLLHRLSLDHDIIFYF